MASSRTERSTRIAIKCDNNLIAAREVGWGTETLLGQKGGGALDWRIPDMNDLK